VAGGAGESGGVIAVGVKFGRFATLSVTIVTLSAAKGPISTG
jgi:hypothetical protein